MATYSTRREPLVSCPYNPAHQVKSGRLPIHITKCRKAYPEVDLRQCPFSVDHLVPASKLNQHIDTCPFKTTVERFLTLPAETGGPSTGTPLPLCATAEDGLGEENWENDVADSPATLEEKIAVPACFPVFANVQPMAPAQRRRYYASLLPRKLDELCEVAPVGKNEEHSRGIPGRTSSERATAPLLTVKQLQKPSNLVDAATGGEDIYESSGDAEGGDDGVHHVSHEREIGGAAGYDGGRRANDDSDQLEQVQLRVKLMGLGRGRGVHRN